jgi:hypothetical protein
MVGCGSEVDEVSKSPSHSYCELDDTVDGLDGSGGQLGIEVGEDAIQSVPIRESGDSHLTHKNSAGTLRVRSRVAAAQPFKLVQRRFGFTFEREMMFPPVSARC